jgi:putative endonuclease
MGLFRRAAPDETLGRWGESLAADHLKKQRYRILKKNYHVGVGEADLVCLSPDRKMLVIVEVKTRRVSEASRVIPEAAINAHKKHKLVQVSHACARKLRWGDKPMCIDVVAIECSEGLPPVVRHYENAVR